MTAHRAERRGGPLITLIGIVMLWAAVRFLIWEAPFVPASLSVMPPDRSLPAAQPVLKFAEPDGRAASRAGTNARTVLQPVERPVPEWQPRPLPLPVVPPQPNATATSAPAARSAVASRGFAAAGQLLAHTVLLRAGYKTPDTIAARHFGSPRAGQASGLAQHMPLLAPGADRQSDVPSRWSLDAWALWRDDSASALLPGRPSYGRSQLGAVMRYRLSPESEHVPQLHLRASRALQGQQEQELAVGLSARPMASVPVRLAAEGRVSDTDFGTETRVAAYAVSEIPPIALPARFSAEAYAQAGFVTGDFATPFVDGQVRITRPLADIDEFRLEAGGGAWGGAQEGAQRLDVGPSAAISFRIGDARGRLSADYRFRVAGDAEPSSGAALTLSAGF